jgi:hypothetical protein
VGCCRGAGDNGVGFNYNVSEPNLLPFYKEAVLTTKLRIMVYNGDADPSINSFVTQDKYFECVAYPPSPSAPHKHTHTSPHHHHIFFCACRDIAILCEFVTVVVMHALW